MNNISQTKKLLAKLESESNEVQGKIKTLRDEVQKWEGEQESIRGEKFYSFLTKDLIDVLNPEHVYNKRVESCTDKNHINYRTCSRCALLELMNFGCWQVCEYEIEFNLRHKGT